MWQRDAKCARAARSRVLDYLVDAPLDASVPLAPPVVPELEPPLGALELDESLVLGDVELAPLPELPSLDVRGAVLDELPLVAPLAPD